MLSAISFRNNTNIQQENKSVEQKKEIKNKSSNIDKETKDKVTISTLSGNDENVLAIAEKKDNGIFYKTVKTFAHAQKTYVTLKEGFFATIAAITAGLTTGAAVLSLDWYIMRLAGHGDKTQSLWKTPFKTVGDAFLRVGKKLCSTWNKTIKDIVKYPFVDFPKDISEYINTSKGISKHGKGLAIGLGIMATCVTAACGLVKVNRARAEVDHGFKIGHNK